MGRPRGAANVISQEAKQSIISVYEALGGAEAMLAWARKNMTDYYKILVAVLPKDINLEAVITHEDRLARLEQLAGHQREGAGISGNA